MRAFDIDWSDFMARLTEWDRLSLPARKAFTELKSDRGSEMPDLDGYAPDLVAAGFLSYCADGRRVKLCNECYPFAGAIRAMTRHDIFGSPGDDTFYAYLHDHLTARQRAVLTPHSHRYAYGDETYLMRQTRTAAWLERLQTAEDCIRWEQGGNFGEPLLNQPGVSEAVRQVVGQFKTFDGPIPFRALPDRFGTLPAAVLGKAILAGIRYLFLFPAMRRDNMTPVIGLWPAITQRLHRPQPKQPKRVEPDETYHSALLMDDMTSVLVAATTRSLRIRANDGALFAKAQKEIMSSLVSVPDWIGQLDGCSPPQRIDRALRLLRMLDYARTAGREGADLSLRTTDRGVDWLAKTAKNRLMAILDRLNPDKARARTKTSSSKAGAFGPAREFIDTDDWYDSSYLFRLIPSSIEIVGTRDWSLLAALARAFETLRGDDSMIAEDFLSGHSQQYNPLLELQREGKPLELSIGWSTHVPSEEETEAVWRNLLGEFAVTRLFPLGGLRMGILGKHRQWCISLTDAGRYLLGLVEDFDYGPEHDGGKPVLVQPNFDVVFTSPSPQAEASIGRFAQRMGQRVGTLFKITKSSIFAAACTGMTSQQVLDTLRRSSAKEVPSNVEREIQGWFDQCRRVTVRRAILVDCPDAHTAARVLAAGGKKATAITETVIELAGSKLDAALFRKLDAMGIFNSQSKPSAEKSRKKDPRRRRW